MENVTFTDKKQEELNNLAINIHIELNSFTKALDLVGGSMINSTILQCYRVKDAIVALMMTHEKYRTTHRQVIWEGEMVSVHRLVYMIMEVLNKIEELSDFKIIQNKPE